ncbi:hypothetical protein Q9Q99_19780 [Curtobacterium flaccumfaciens]|nr:hypothetical protein Q9Q99_19780 [Curtobacterium flaccumfaciens]
MPGRHLIHHLGVFASDFAASDSFYTAALAPLGIGAGYRTDSVAEFWQHGDDTPSVSLETARSPEATTRGLHLAFEAGSRSEVDAFHREAVAAGGCPGTSRATGRSTTRTPRSCPTRTATTSKR